MLKTCLTIARRMQAIAKRDGFELKFRTSKFGGLSLMNEKQVVVSHAHGMICFYERKGFKGKIWIGTIVVERESRGKGVGGFLLRKLIEAADSRKLDLALRAVPFNDWQYDGMDEDTLIKWYEKYDFKGKRNEFDITMVRKNK